MAPNLDHYHREITYLRVSVTDRCNLRCVYCVPARNFQPLNHHDILTFEETKAIIEAAVAVGIRKVRFTGGDPLVRKGIVNLVESVTCLKGLKDVSITTNGILLKELAGPLFSAGIRRINVSLDTLNPLTFRKITGIDAFHDVIEGIEVAESVGFSPIRINVVVMKGMNDSELEAFAEMSVTKPYQVRFIEYMPIGNDHVWTPEKFIPTAEMKGRIEKLGPLMLLQRSQWDGPVERYRLSESRGEIGFISPLSQHFCPCCDRLRLTADGKLRPCLFSQTEVDIKTPMRTGANAAQLEQLIQQAIDIKPKQHYATTYNKEGRSRPMTAIGG